MILSDTNPSVSWRLNDLLKAGKKAKAFATASWRTPENPEQDQGFIQWQPTKLNELPDGARETESLDMAEEVEAEEEAEAAEAVEPVVEEPVEPEPSFDVNSNLRRPSAKLMRRAIDLVKRRRRHSGNRQKIALLNSRKYCARRSPI